MRLWSPHSWRKCSSGIQLPSMLEGARSITLQGVWYRAQGGHSQWWIAGRAIKRASYTKSQKWRYSSVRAWTRRHHPKGKSLRSRKRARIAKMVRWTAPAALISLDSSIDVCDGFRAAKILNAAKIMEATTASQKKERITNSAIS